MSKKKKRRSKPAPSSRTRSEGAVLADEKQQVGKRFKPAARNLLLLNLVFLAAVQLLYNQQLISELLSNICTVIGIILLFLALWIQFGGGPSGDATPKPPRLK